jgi:hypothetical protein
MYQLEFPYRYQLTRSKHGLVIPVGLSRGALLERTEAKIDTGAEYCLFSREIGEALEIEIESGLPQTFSTLTGSLAGYGHEVTLQSFDLTFSSFVYFAKDYGLQRNLLGSIGWLRKVNFGLVDNEEVFYLGSYDS